MKSVFAITLAAIITTSDSKAEEPLIKIYGPENHADNKTQQLYLSISILEFENNPFDASMFNPLTYFEVNSFWTLPVLYTKASDDYFSQVESSSDPGDYPAPSGKGVSGLFSDPQFQVLIRTVTQKKDVIIHRPPSAYVSEYQFFCVEQNNEVILAGGASPKGDGVVALSLHTPSNPGGPIPKARNTSLVVVDGATVAYTMESNKGRKTRVYFIKPQLLDPEG